MLRFLTILLAVLFAPCLWAQTPEPFPEFTFKRIAPPSAGTSRRITVQIDPDAPVAPRPDLPASSETPDLVDPKITAFWQAIAPGIEAASPARLGLAVQAVSAFDLPTPSLANLQTIASIHGRTILGASVTEDVSPALVLAVITVESSGNVQAESSAGAQGLMQLIPATADRFDVDDALDPVQNITGGARYLSWLLKEFGGDPILALAGYNAGENAVKRAGGVPEFAETRAYVPKVIAAWSVAKGLCLTPPELPTDGCVFASMAAN